MQDKTHIYLKIVFQDTNLLKSKEGRSEENLTGT